MKPIQLQCEAVYILAHRCCNMNTKLYTGTIDMISVPLHLLCYHCNHHPCEIIPCILVAEVLILTRLLEQGKAA